MKAQKHYSLQGAKSSNELPSKNTSSLPKLVCRTVFSGVILLIGLLTPKYGFCQLSGTYTIDSTQPVSKTNYLNLHSAFIDLDSGKRYDGFSANGPGVNGPVILKMADGTYNYGGTPATPVIVALSSVSGSSATNTITLTSASSDSSKVLFSNMILGLDNVHNVVLSKIGFNLKYTGGSASIFIMMGSNITITHSLFQTTAKNIGIIKYDSDTTDSVMISHNNFQGSSLSMELNEVKNLYVTDNIVSNASSSSGLPNGYLSFFSSFGDRNLIIRNNTFLRNVDTAFAVVSKGFYVSNNRILANTAIYVGGEDSTADTIVNNTLITHHCGIYDIAYYDYENLAILDNNIYTDSTGVGGSGECIYVENKYAPFNSIMNNNIVNGPGREGIHFTSTKVRGTIDYNNYYYYAGSFGSFGTSYADLNSFQLATGFERHGLNLNPQYNPTNNLETGNINLEGKGITVNGVKYDINGKLRNLIAPTIGAYEIAVSDSLNVWPGDANNDGRVDINDLLAVGIAYDKTGPARINATTNWIPQPCNDWTNAFENGINEKFADCNGNGTIDSNDVSAIALNFTKLHFKTLTPASGSPSDPPLTVKFLQDSVQAGDSVTAIISLGSNAIKANNIYGVTLSINYGAYMLGPKSITTDFSKSWLGTIHKNMVSLVVNDNINKIIYIGLTRTDHSNMSGAGEIGKVSIYMPDNVAGKREVKQYFNMQIINYKSISANEDTISLNPISDSALVYEYKSGINTANLKHTNLEIYPNPAKNNIYIKADNTLIENITISDIVGRAVYQSVNNSSSEITVPVSTLPSGLYFMDVMTKNGATRSRFIKE